MYKKPVSVLVVIHTAAPHVLLLERARHPGFWQSVTGSQEDDEPLIETARREVREETGIAAAAADLIDWQLTNRYEIFAEWRYRYAPGVTHNTEHVFSLCLPEASAVTVAPEEHLGYRWLPWREAAAACFSWSNRDAILELPRRFSGSTASNRRRIMALPAEVPVISPEEYLRWETSQMEKHEYVAGEVFAMGGASRRHVTITLNLSVALDDALTGTPCRVYTADMKIEVATKGCYFYPDVFVTCHPDDHRAELAMCHPVLVAEVLSPLTAAYDRGDKFIAYRSLPTLKEYLLIDPDHRQVELFRKGADGLWVLHDFAPSQTLQLTSVQAAISWERLFRNVD